MANREDEALNLGNSTTKKREVFPKICHYCGKPIETPRDLVYKYILLRNSKNEYHLRELHHQCAPKISDMTEAEERRIENNVFHKCCDLMYEWFDINTSSKLNEYIVQRILGLRIGKKFAKGDNVIGVEKGYGFDVIYNTMLYSSNTVKLALSSGNFNNDRHKVNYVIAILENNINFIKQRMNKKKLEEEQLLNSIDYLNKQAVFITDFNGDSLKSNKSKLVSDFNEDLKKEINNIEGNEFVDLFE